MTTERLPIARLIVALIASAIQISSQEAKQRQVQIEILRTPSIGPGRLIGAQNK
jgi:hypothetical protein